MDSRTRKIGGLVIAAVGAVVAVVGGLADQLGLGGEGPDEFGTTQLLALIAGLVLVAIGLVVALVLKGQKTTEPEPNTTA